MELFPNSYGIPCAVSACNGVESMEGLGTLPDTALGCAAILLVWRTATGATCHDRWINRTSNTIIIMTIISGSKNQRWGFVFRFLQISELFVRWWLLEVD